MKSKLCFFCLEKCDNPECDLVPVSPERRYKGVKWGAKGVCKDPDYPLLYDFSRALERYRAKSPKKLSKFERAVEYMSKYKKL